MCFVVNINGEVINYNIGQKKKKRESEFNNVQLICTVKTSNCLFVNLT